MLFISVKLLAYEKVACVSCFGPSTLEALGQSVVKSTHRSCMLAILFARCLGFLGFLSWRELLLQHMAWRNTDSAQNRFTAEARSDTRRRCFTQHVSENACPEKACNLLAIILALLHELGTKSPCKLCFVDYATA